MPPTPARRAAARIGTPRYTTVSDVLSTLRAPQDTWWDTAEATEIVSRSIDTAEDMIDLRCGTEFSAVNATEQPAEPRTYRTDSPTVLLTEWFAAPPTSVAVNGSPVAVDWWHRPITAAAAAGRNLRTRASGGGWPTANDIDVTALWGFAAVPASVTAAATRLAARIVAIGTAPLGHDARNVGNLDLPPLDWVTDRLLARWLPRVGHRT